MAKYDDMSFGRAFGAERREKGKGKTFTWKGKSYSTNYKEETSGGSSRSGEDSTVTRARRAIERAEAEKAPSVRPRARPTEKPKVRPRARPAATAPTSKNASSPEVTTTPLEPAAQGRARRGSRTDRPPEGPRTTGPNDNSPRRGGYSFNQWREMSRKEREEAGLPTSIAGAQIYFRRSKTTRGMAKGGMVKKTGYAKGGVVKANCGASMKPTQKKKY